MPHTLRLDVSWTENGTEETISFKDAPFPFRILKFPEELTPLCERGNLTLLAIVQSTPANAKARNAIRVTWANPNDVRSLKYGAARVVFLIGDGHNASEALLSEINDKQDIILIDTADTYKNLVYKTAISLFISHTHCPTPFLLKIDHDVAFAIDRFIPEIGRVFHADQASIYCRVHYLSTPHRKNYSRWYVSERQYADWRYPHYCAGPAYVFTAHAVNAVIANLPEFEQVRVEDVFFTGLIASAAGVRRIGMQAKFKTEYRRMHLSSSDCSGLVLAIHNLKTEQEMGNAWRFLTREC